MTEMSRSDQTPAIPDPLDPRNNLPDLLSQYDLSPTDLPLPCGQEVCRPFEGDCIQPDDINTTALARLVCSQSMALEVLGRRVNELEELIGKVSVDANTGVLTYNAQKVLVERMFAKGHMEKMRQRGYIAEVTIADLDRLGQHNALGGHEGGDAALRAFARALKPFYRRKNDNLMIRSPQLEQGILAYEEDAREAIELGQTFPQLGRFETGDEVVGLSWVEPPKGRRESVPPSKRLEAVQQRVESIARGLRGLRVEYPYTSKMSPDALRAQFGDSSLDFSVDFETGIVNTSVSAAFAIAVGPLPASMEDFQGMFRRVDEEAMGLKNQGDRTKSRGVAKSLFVAS
jgi:GGDEF domain-containing protein